MLNVLRKSLVILFYCVVYLNSPEVQGPQSNFFAFLTGWKDQEPLDMCHLGSCGKKPRKHLYLTDVDYIHTAVCSVRFLELVRNVFLYLNILSSGPANCLKWKGQAGKAKLQQTGLFERQWHFKVDFLNLPHAFWKSKKRLIFQWNFSKTYRCNTVTDQPEFCVFLAC